MQTPDWTTLQLCDSAFPAGAIAHSGGLEAAWQQGEIEGPDGLARWISAALGQAASTMVPFVAAGWSGDPPLNDADALCDAFLLNPVANRASRSQGQATLMAAARTFELPEVGAIADAVRAGKLAGHHAPAFGAVTRLLDISRPEACDLFLFLALRGAVSSAVRLGVVGPLQGQNIQHRVGRSLAGLAGRFVDCPLDEVAQTAPLADLLQGAQDRLYSRLFVS